MGRYSSYGIATLYGIPLNELEERIRREAYGKTLDDLNLDGLRTYYPENIYDIRKTESAIYISLKESFTGNEISSLLKDFAEIAPNQDLLSPEEADKIGEVIKDKPLDEVMELAERGKFYGFQTISLPYYLYDTPVIIGDKKVYTPTMVDGFLINYDYSKTNTEDDTQPYRFLTELLRYRLKENPLAPTLLAYLSV